MSNFNVIGDLEGRILTLKALLAQMPPAELICLGDPNDRGPSTKELIEFLMNNGRTVQSNHAHMMTTEVRERANPHMVPRYYESGIWPERNGGLATMRSYTLEPFAMHELPRIIPESHIKFLEECPMYIETENFIMSHAPCRQKGTLEEMSDIGTGFYQRFGVDNKSEYSLLWNRFVPNRPNPELKGKINLFGHNSSDNVKVFCPLYPHGIKVSTEETWQECLENKPWAIGLDTSAGGKLTGLHLPTMTLYSQEFID
jgi:hypothetical protein